jgi:hypothetical protein
MLWFKFQSNSCNSTTVNTACYPQLQVCLKKVKTKVSCFVYGKNGIEKQERPKGQKSFVKNVCKKENKTSTKEQKTYWKNLEHNQGKERGINN